MGDPEQFAARGVVFAELAFEAVFFAHQAGGEDGAFGVVDATVDRFRVDWRSRPARIRRSRPSSKRPGPRRYLPRIYGLLRPSGGRSRWLAEYSRLQLADENLALPA